MRKYLKKTAWSLISMLAKKASRNYIAGEKLEDALRISRYLSDLGYWVTLGYWDRAEDDLASVMELYISTMEHLSSIEGRNYLSIKLPAIHYNNELFNELIIKSQTSNVPLHIDSLAPEYADNNISFLVQYSEASSLNLGCTLPARWRRTMNDINVVSPLGVNIRVVKGQWLDPDYPDSDPNAEYIDVIRKLAGKSNHIRVATHNLDLARESLTILKEHGSYCELELLYGLPVNGLVALANQLEVPVRIYVAFGNAYLPYALTSISKHPLMLWQLFKEAFKQDYLTTFTECISNKKY